MACGCCEHRRLALLCPDCFVASCAGRRGDKHALAAQRDAAEQQLAALVADKAEHQRQRLALLQLCDELRCTQSKAAEVERQLAAVRQRLSGARRELADREERMTQANRQLSQLVNGQLGAASPYMAAFDQQVLLCQRLDAALREQRTRVVRRAMQILPLTLVPPIRPASPSQTGAGSSGRDTNDSSQAASSTSGGANGNSGGASRQRPPLPATSAAAAPAAAAGQPQLPPDRAAAMICSLLLPDSRAGWAELGTSAQTLGSALGYLALLLDLLSRLLQLPLPHSRCAFQGSTSRMWQPDSWWDMRASPPADALLLAWPKVAAEGHHEWGASLAAMGSGGAAAQAQARARAEQQLRAALHTLARGAGALVFARLGPEAPLKVPPDWSPFAWLAGLCKVLAAEAAGPQRPPSARVAVPPGAAHPLAASGVFGRYSPEAGSMAQSVLLFPDGADDAVEEDWEHLPRPAYGMIPPPPSQPEDVEHWVAAHGLQAAPDGSGGNSSSPVPAALYGSSPMARLRALTRAALGTLPLGSGSS
ncbi:hypothetical protein C2E21_0461 [Chlorella sorokiniana]|uniref:Uncharacterized protein n=1 Tax=Chlorella sorokiniana TaxID=3076 RepID=A0A2P6U3X2_CHLSO|nr:hypothetical protein C2E21_0461 [Chlorella sorokiniana]|eukprot:PRW61012.1 hypothetical protein C2E21_0461 [Chlorella sorokiniana]